MSVVAEILIVFGLVTISLGVVGLFRMPDVYTRVQAATKASSLGTIALLAAALLDGDGPSAARVVLIAGFLLVTAPVGAHAISRAAYRRDERVYGAADEGDG